MSQNIYDDPDFFDGYAQLPRSVHGLSGAPEWPILRSMLPDLDDARVLDLGCGYGWFARWAIEHGAASVMAIDISERMLERATRATPPDHAITYRRSDLDDVTLAPTSVEVAYSSLALHYITDLPRLIGEVSGALVPGGSFVCSVEHPIRTAPIEPSFVIDPSGAVRWQLDHYLVEGSRTVDWIGDRVVKQHRTVSTYVTTLLDAGFQLTHVNEWCPSDAELDQHPDWSNELHRPSFLLIGARRYGGDHSASVPNFLSGTVRR